jgi:signal transduction histidine kinase
MPLGKTTLYIKGINIKAGIISKPIAITTVVNIPLQKRLWFWPLIFMSFLFFLAYSLVRIILNRKQSELKQKLAIEQERLKISADLHDEIGASLSSLQINSAVAHFLMTKDPKEAKSLLQKIESQSAHLSGKIGDIIWSMKPGKDEFLTISSRIKNFANDILDAANIAYKIDIDSKADLLITNILSRKNIVLFIKEATNNAAKYSNAGIYQVRLFIQEKTIVIEIKDDGSGFDTKGTIGNGVGNMAKRIQELNGQFTIQSEKNKGTIIKAVIPLVP